MNSRSLLNLLLLVVVIALAAVAYQRQTQNDQVQHLTSLQRDAINTIVIPRSKGDIVLNKTANGWRMQSPYQLRAHDFRIARLIDMATQPVDKQYEADNLQLEKFGIDDHSSSIRLNDTEIRYGELNPVNNRRYVLVNDKLYLIDDQLYPLINSQPSSFADLALVDNTQSITDIRLPDMRIYKNSQGSWQVDAGNRDTSGIDADSIQTLVDNWQSAQAFGVHAYMKRKQLGHIELHLQDNTVIKLVISEHSPWLILGRPQLGIEYHFDKNFNDRLLKLPSTKTAKPGNHA